MFFQEIVMIPVEINKGMKEMKMKKQRMIDTENQHVSEFGDS